MNRFEVMVLLITRGWTAGVWTGDFELKYPVLQHPAGVRELREVCKLLNIDCIEDVGKAKAYWPYKGKRVDRIRFDVMPDEKIVHCLI